MSGHSKWAQIKRKKGVADQQRGKIFSKIIREITVAARRGGKPEANPTLRQVIEKAKSVNMPQDNIKKAVQRGTGELEGVNYEEITYEGYGPSGVAILVNTLTDNKKRTASEIRNLFSKFGGNMGEAGCVSWMFSQKGVISVEKNKISEDELMAVALDAGAIDFKNEETNYDIITKPEDFEKVKATLQKKEIEISSSEITMVPNSNIELTGKEASQCLSLVSALEDHDDVQNVYANFDIPEKVLTAPFQDNFSESS